MTPRERLLLFGRLPEPGRTKTRLAAALGAGPAARLYRAFLDDLVARGRPVAETELWVPDRPEAERTLSARYPDVAIRLQPAGDLGARLAAAFERAFSERTDYAVAVGTDHPTLPLDYLRRAFRGLRSAHLVLGPTEDGGYYAIGLRRYAWPRARGLFEGAPWSEPDLLAWTRNRAEALGLCHVELPTWYDVDVMADLERLARDAVSGSETAQALESLTRSPAAEAERP